MRRGVGVMLGRKEEEEVVLRMLAVIWEMRPTGAGSPDREAPA